MRYVIVIIAVMILATNLYAFRMQKPFTFTHPLDAGQIEKLNALALDIWNITNGRQNFDTVTVAKTRPDNGELYILTTGSTARIIFRSGDQNFTITPDGF